MDLHCPQIYILRRAFLNHPIYSCSFHNIVLKWCTLFHTYFTYPYLTLYLFVYFYTEQFSQFPYQNVMSMRAGALLPVLRIVSGTSQVLSKLFFGTNEYIFFKGKLYFNNPSCTLVVLLFDHSSICYSPFIIPSKILF